MTAHEFEACLASLGPDAKAFELRSLTLLPEWRGSSLSYLLMFAASQHILSCGGTHVASTGKLSDYEVSGIKVKKGVPSNRKAGLWLLPFDRVLFLDVDNGEGKGQGPCPST